VCKILKGEGTNKARSPSLGPSAAVTQVYSHLEPDQLHETVNRLRIAVDRESGLKE